MAEHNICVPKTGKRDSENKTFCGEELTDKSFNTEYRTELIRGFKKQCKNSIKDLELIIDKFSSESYKVQSQMGQNARIQRKNFERAVLIICETVKNMHTEIEIDNIENSFFSFRNRNFK